MDGGPSQVATNTMISNAGVVTVDDHGVLELKGTINNTGEIMLQGADDAVLPVHAPETELVMLPSGPAMPRVTLKGHGQIVLNDNSHNLVTGGSFNLLNPSLITLINIDNTITGAGTIGGNGLVLNNKAGGEIDATVSTPLIIDTGTNTVTNAGILGSTASCDAVHRQRPEQYRPPQHQRRHHRLSKARSAAPASPPSAIPGRSSSPLHRATG